MCLDDGDIADGGSAEGAGRVRERANSDHCCAAGMPQGGRRRGRARAGKGLGVGEEGGAKTGLGGGSLKVTDMM